MSKRDNVERCSAENISMREYVNTFLYDERSQKGRNPMPYELIGKHVLERIHILVSCYNGRQAPPCLPKIPPVPARIAIPSTPSTIAIRRVWVTQGKYIAVPTMSELCSIWHGG